MNSHPYLRAYMAGIALPTFFMLFILAAFIVARFVYDIPIPIERAIAFPMAVVPNLWGVWNILYTAGHGRRWPLGLHGAVLPLLLMPAGLLLAKHLGINVVTPSLAMTFAPVGVAVYYLVWKYAVGFLNETLGVA
jgi:hypothetical protein